MWTRFSRLRRIRTTPPDGGVVPSYVKDGCVEAWTATLVEYYGGLQWAGWGVGGNTRACPPSPGSCLGVGAGIELALTPVGGWCVAMVSCTWEGVEETVGGVEAEKRRDGRKKEGLGFG